MEVERPKPPLNEEWRKSKAVSTEKSGLFCFYGKKKKARLSARKEITLDLLANHSNDQGLLHEVVGFHHLLNLRFL